MGIQAIIIQAVIGLIFSIILALVGNYAKSVEKKADALELRCKELEKNTNRQQIEITELRSKLWSEDKLEKTIENAVERSFLKAENRRLEKEKKLK